GVLGSGTVTLGGNALTFDAAGSGNAAINLNTQGSVNLSSAINFGTTNPNMALNIGGTGAGTLTLSGAITGSPTNTLVINTAAKAVTSVTGNNTTFLGTTTLTQGILQIGNVNALGGQSSNTITINGANTILAPNLAAAGTIANDIAMTGTNNLNIVSL